MKFVVAGSFCQLAVLGISRDFYRRSNQGNTTVKF